MTSLEIQVQEGLRTRAKQALGVAQGEIMVATRAGFAHCKDLRAQAEPILGMIETAQAKINQAVQTIAGLDNALARLEPFKELIEVGPLYAVLQATKPVVTAVIAVEQARIALATIAIPDPAVLGAVAVVVAAKEVERQANSAISQFFKLLESET